MPINFTGMINTTPEFTRLNFYVTYVRVKNVLLPSKAYSIPNTIFTEAFIVISPASIGVDCGAAAILLSAKSL